MTDRDRMIVDAYGLAARILRRQWGRSVQGQAVPDALGEAVCKWLRLRYDQRAWSARKHAHYLAHWASDLLKDPRERTHGVRKASRHVRVLLMIELPAHGLGTDHQESNVIEWLDRHVAPDMPDETAPATWREAFDALLSAGWSRAAIARLCKVSEEAARQWHRGRYDPSPDRQLLIEQAATRARAAASTGPS